MSGCATPLAGRGVAGTLLSCKSLLAACTIDCTDCMPRSCAAPCAAGKVVGIEKHPELVEQVSTATAAAAIVTTTAVAAALSLLLMLVSCCRCSCGCRCRCCCCCGCCGSACQRMPGRYAQRVLLPMLLLLLLLLLPLLLLLLLLLLLP